jgi:U32 family peptidase
LKDDVVMLEFGNGDIDFSRIRSGDLVWRSHDPQLKKFYKPLTDATEPFYTRPLSFEVVARRGERLVITAKIENGLSATVVGSVKLEPATKRALDKSLLREHLGKLGGTAFHLDSVELDPSEPLFIPVSELNSLRRDLVKQLMDLRVSQPARRTQAVVAEALNKLLGTGAVSEKAKLHVLVRTPEQLEAAVEARPESITLDYLELYGLKPSVEKVKAASIRCRVASPRILKPTEQNVLKFLLSLDCELVVRSGGLLYDLQKLPNVPKLTGDFSLNAANVLSTQMYLEMGLSAITPTHDLNAAQIAALTQHVDASKLEVTAYQHLPVFHMEHCVFCRFLSQGTDYTNCGHPCETHRVALRDKQGRLHPVMADVGCRNTVFGAEAQVGAKHLKTWLEAGISNFRLEFVHESPKQVRQVITAFQKTLAGEKSFDALQKELSKILPSGTTEGSLFVPQDFSHLPQLL